MNMNAVKSSVQSCVVAMAIVVFTSCANATSFKPETIDSSYEHDRWKTSCTGITREFAAFKSCFDDADDDNQDGSPDIWGVPEWVSYEMKKLDRRCIKTSQRPSKWFGDPSLVSQGIMPSDRSYAYPGSFVRKRKDWYSRGHLAMKMHAERIGYVEGWNTHTFFNAVPQRQLFNAGIWLDMEYLTAAWAQKYGAVWVVTGPVFADKAPYAHLGEVGELPVAIPDALFKVVVKEGLRPGIPDVLAFIYPQVGPGYYGGKPYNHLRYVTTVDEIEKLTGIDFFSLLPPELEKPLEREMADALWPVEGEHFLPACKSTASTLND